MTRATRVRCALSLLVLVLSAVLAVAVPPRLGLDLRGGTQIVLETRDTADARADATATDRTLEVLRQRVDALGVAEPTLTRSGENRIIVELPGVQDPAEAADVLGRTAQLTFHPVLGAAAPDAEADEEGEEGEEGERTLPDEEGRPLRLGPAELTGAQVSGAEALLETQRATGWYVTVDFDGAGEAAWAAVTGRAACAAPGDPTRRVAIVLDDEVISSPSVASSVACGTGITGGTTQITGDFTADDARELELLVNGGALPVPVETVEQRTVGPTLGERAIEASAWAALIGAALTSLFVIVVYRLLGLLAACALVCYALISYAALVALGATLTLPGLAGFALAIGMAVDANVLVFERAREEYTARRATTVRTALAAGFRRAFSAIADTNITTLIAAALLFLLASGPVRGFGVTLGIGVLASMFSALVITRALAGLTVDRPGGSRRAARSGVAVRGRVRTWLERRGPRPMRRHRLWLALSAVAVALAACGIGVRGLELGVEFTGGRMVEYATERPVGAEEARDALADAGFPGAVVQTTEEGEVSVRVQELSNEEEAEVGRVLAGLGDGGEKVRDEMIGPSMGAELRTAALWALGAALAVQLAYLAFRFRWTYATAAVVALVHDAVILVGAFAWLGRPVDGVFLAALLTVIGYSVNDSVVVFDRLRELRAAGGGEGGSRRPFAEDADAAITGTLPRTVNTGMGVLFVLCALALLGGGTLTDFALALLIGLVVGTASSVFTATPLTVALHGGTRGRERGRTPGREHGGEPERERAGAR
ncbi:protein translocase subunit secF /protein translocase subunit secD [Streptomyces zhaozhouensis]|uniref:Multifunctional fusion protein n=1 Tax=Streptomyces zhaozhouensis TaxID=1300267 RepID=A0A286DKJ7_9ACTN|nr:protein translocase subunit SecD [Streptomyces zhaozhouensis]SOD59265.1 protein translocase subunit secF /protein translocase subunit secD [Streptomyces zhaozhouensis]